MRGIQKFILGMLIGMFLLALFNFNLFPYIKANSTDSGYDGPDGEKSGASIGFLIVQGAGYSLTAQSETLKFMNRIEMSEISGIDFNELEVIIAAAVDKMDRAKDVYWMLKVTADHTPYNPEVIEKLASFDYQGFQTRHGLNGPIFAEVKNFLKNGDIRGLYARMLADAEELSGRLHGIKTMVDAGQFPEIYDLWRLNQEFSESLLLGQYASEVFFQLDK
ncbi:MAG: hypothetical protein GTO45_28660 [Candidatus Aminicenantes bacterium]|nr:hypothetical protein [Candidatus Aminicenantes bacterium]NIM82771.1 hypothetical protein [Candidatus Aminicenantes bacterium]NIN22146.1 hypothetical protein [Candidatus Aminicenantes bacterium]NIN45903.1 hypothetical protein [Candidatus Aminicenantes bacterium]NIN88742.1 hypothetical protein [Candidatus Aminicenantes bacterium]